MVRDVEPFFVGQLPGVGVGVPPGHNLAPNGRSGLPRRRWFRFSLRTLLVVVTVMACAAWWAQRQIRWIEARDAFIADVHAMDGGIPAQRTLARAPLALRLFGGRNWEVIDLPKHATAEQIQFAAQLFPEADIWIGGQRRLDRSTGEIVRPPR